MIHPEVYLEAAREHASSAALLYNDRRYGLAHYVSGLAVECMLRAYRVKRDPQFDSRHNLKELTKLARLYDVVPLSEQVSLAARMSEVIQRWSNEHRYRSEKALLKWLRAQRINWQIKGDALKESARRIVDAALEIVNQGVLRWRQD